MSDKTVDRDTIIEAVVQAIPYVGAPLATLYFGNKQEKRFRRLDKFYQELKEEMSKSPNVYKDITQHNPEELSAIIEELNENVTLSKFGIKFNDFCLH